MPGTGGTPVTLGRYIRYRGLDSTFTLNRMEGESCPPLARQGTPVRPPRFSLSAPPAREDSPLSVSLEALPGFQAAVGRGRQYTAGLCAAGIRRLPEVREA